MEVGQQVDEGRAEPGESPGMTPPTTDAPATTASATTPPTDVADLDALAEATLADSSGLRALVGRSRQRVTAGQERLNGLIDKYHERPLLDVGLRIFQRDREGAGTLVASALAFRLFLFFVPLML